jgi:7-cyano-7-deazaguanine synthase
MSTVAPSTTGTRRAVVLLSGGLDSATVLALARRDGFACHALSVHYGQRHSSELDAAARVAVALGAVEHRVFRVDLAGIGGSSLTDPSIPVPETPAAGIPSTYVPARNTLMLALALGWAEVLGASDLFIGVNAVDYSGYPDCRPEFIAAFEQMARLATRAGVEGGAMRVNARCCAGRSSRSSRKAWRSASTSGSPCPATRPTPTAGPAGAATPAGCGARDSTRRAWPTRRATRAPRRASCAASGPRDGQNRSHLCRIRGPGALSSVGRAVPF